MKTIFSERINFLRVSCQAEEALENKYKFSKKDI